MNCPECSKPIEDDAVKCPHCAYDFSGETVQGDPSTDDTFQKAVLDDSEEDLDTATVDIDETVPLDRRPAARKPKSKSGFIGKYRIIRELGRGAMGVVVLAEDPGLKREVAIKTMIAGEDATEESIARFTAEARAAGKLQHPGIVGVHEIGQERALYYMVMDYIDGRSLKEIIKEGALPPRRAAEVIRDVAQALDYAHSNGIIHRDLKPGNVMVKDSGSVYLADFGLARNLESVSSLTKTGQIMGTPAYMNPEQAGGESRKVDARSDVYSLGAVFYELLAGRPPVKGDTVMQIIYQVLQEDPVRPAALNPQLDRDLEIICMKAMFKEPERRYQTAGELAQDLQHYLDGEPISARPASVMYKLGKRIRKHRIAILTGAAILLMCLVAVYFIFINPRQKAAAEARAKLADLQILKQETEEAVAGLIETGQFTEAVAAAEEVYNTVPAVPADLKVLPQFEEFPGLKTVFKVDLPGAYYELGVQQLGRGDPAGRVSLANAYRTAILGGADATGVEALLRLGRELEKNRDNAGALALYKICARRFPPQARVLKALALALETNGELEQALQAWNKVAELDPAAVDELRTGVLKNFLSRRTFPFNQSSLGFADLNGNGRDELLFFQNPYFLIIREFQDGKLKELQRIRLTCPDELLDEYFRGEVRALNVDADPELEIVVGIGLQRLSMGQLFILDRKDGRYFLKHTVKLPSSCLFIEAYDIEGDGIKEIFAGVDWYARALAVIKVTENEAKIRGFMRLGSDPQFMHFVDMPDDSRGGFLLHLGLWLIKRGFRLYYGNVGPDGRLKIRGEADEHIIAHNMVELGNHTYALLANRRPKIAKVMPDLQPFGIYRFRLERDGFTPFEKIGPDFSKDFKPATELQKIMSNGRTLLAFREHEKIWVVDTESGRYWSYAVAWDKSWRFSQVFSGDFDGDGQTELLYLKDTDLEIWGLPAAEGEESPQKTEWTIDQAGRKLSPGDELLQAGLFDEARDIFRRATGQNADDYPSWFGLGVALYGLKQYEKAADAFGRAARGPKYTVSAGMRKAGAWEEARDWDELAMTLKGLSALPGLDPYARDRVENWISWAEPAARMDMQVDIQDMRSIPVICENPFSVLLVKEGLMIWVNSMDYYLAGFPFKYAGGPFKVEFKVEFSELDWGTGACLGLQHFGQLRNSQEDRIWGPRFHLNYRASGASDLPVEHITLSSVARDGQAYSIEVPEKTEMPQPGTEYICTLEYIPGLDKVFGDMVNSMDSPVFPSLVLPASFNLENGIYALGNCVNNRQGPGGLDKTTRILIKGISIDSLPTNVGLTGMNALAMSLYVANGCAAVGRLDACERMLDDIEGKIRESGNKDLQWQARLTRSLVLFRKGKEKEAEASLREAMALEAQGVRQLVSGMPPEFPQKEREFYKGILGPDPAPGETERTK